MSKRRRASELMFGNGHTLRYPVNVYTVLSGTGTCTKGGAVCLVASATATACYLTMTSGSVKGILCGTTTIITG